jgi:sugar/nucleoside kinase (ribokinase family)
MNQFDLISIGDSTLDIFLEVNPQDAVGVCNLNEEKCVVEFEYGAKIPVTKLTRIAAVGNAANNACGSARLGLKTAIYTVTGSDADSLESKQIFEQEGVDTSLMVLEEGKKSNFSAVISYSAERNIFVYHEERKYDISQIPKADWAYFTSVGKGHEILHEQIPNYVKTYGVKLGYNPGSHELREGVEVIKPIMAVTDVLLVNREEAQGLVGGDLNDIKGLISRLYETGPKMIVITDGRGGSYASPDGHEVWFAGIPEQSPVIERTGCGDAYSTGFLGALAQKLPLPDAMIWGTMNATSVIQYIGAREGLLTRRGIDEFIAKYGQFVRPTMI